MDLKRACQWALLSAACLLVACLEGCAAQPDARQQTVLPAVSYTIPPDEPTATGIPAGTPEPVISPSPTLAPTTGPTGSDLVMEGWTPDDLTITFISNAGFMFTSGDVKVVIDAFFVGFSGRSVSVELTDLMERAEPPFDRVDLILVTHDHDDHFSADIVASHLRNNPDAVLVSTEAAAGRTREAAPDLDRLDERVIGISLEDGEQVEMNVQGVPLTAFNISHGVGAEILNLGFMVTMGGYRLFHTGDMGDNIVLPDYGLDAAMIDFALVPWFMMTDPDLRAVLEDNIRPRYAIPIHFDYTAATPTRIVSMVSAAYPEAIILYPSFERLIVQPAP